MYNVFLGEGSLVSYIFADAGAILFGALIFLFGVALTLITYIKRDASMYAPLIVTQTLVLIILLGIVTIDLFQAPGTLYTIGALSNISETFSAHRALLIQLPIFSTIASVVILLTYRERIHDKHALSYRTAIAVSTVTSFLVILLIGFESMI